MDFPAQNHTKGCTITGTGLILEHAAVFFDDARGNRETQASACFRGAQKRVEKALFDLWRDALTGVGHFKDNGVGLATAEGDPGGPSPKGDCARAFNGLYGIADQIDQNLLQMTAVSTEEQLWAELNQQLHLAALQTGRH